MNKIKTLYYSIIYGIENLYIWFFIIWQDRNWDHYFIYKILHKKLSLMEYNIRKYGMHVRSDKDAGKIKICVLLLDRLLKDDYFENVCKNHDKKWGKSDFIFHDNVRLEIKYANVKIEKDKENQIKDFRKCMKSETELKEQDLDLLFKIMRKNIQTWWD